MEPPISPVLFSIFFFLGMLTMLEIGRRFCGEAPLERARRRAE
jgi:hypothetical protein